MEYIKKEELKDGDVFVAQLSSHHFLNKEGTKFYIELNTNNSIKNEKLYNAGTFSYRNIRIATPEEKHWLESCITADKFITFEEAMKTFIPEYVELLDRGCRINNEVIANKIYKCSNDSTKSYHFGFLLDNRFRIGFNKSEFNQYLKISTKEAYDAQFVVIEPLPQFKVIETIETITKVENNEGNQFFIGDVVISSNGVIQTIESFNYNKTKTNIIAFTNKQSILGNGIGIDKIEHYIESKVEETLLEKAKRLYPVGTKVNSLGGSPNQTIDSNTPFMSGDVGVRFTMNCLVYLNGKWAEIIE